MRRFASFRTALAVVAAVLVAQPSAAQTAARPEAQPRRPAEFVRVRHGAFAIGTEPYYFTGVNFWFGPYLGAGLVPGDRERLVRELDHLARLGVRNLRVMAASEGPATEPSRVTPAFQERPGVYDERLLGGLDVLLAEMAKRDMRAVLVLNNFFQWTGGMAQYVSWATGDPIPYPERNGNSWDDFQQFSARFYAVDSAQTLFERYLAHVLGRRNTVTGVAYRDDPTIMSWQLSNEPRGFAHSDAYVRWVDRAGAFVKRHAPNQLVSLGGEGKLDRGTPNTNTQFERVSRSPWLDYLTIHLWIENWGWFDPARPDETFNRSVGRSLSYITDHVAIARILRKPIVLEEFGVSRDRRVYDPAATTQVRDRFYEMILEAVRYLASEEPHSVVAGANLWSWSGESRPPRPGEYWRVGDPFTGDPPHERQGWYAIYAGDTTTLSLLARYARSMDEIGRAPRPAMPATAP